MFMALRLILIAPNQWIPMQNIRYLFLKKRAKFHIRVKDMTTILLGRLILAPDNTPNSYVYGYLRQEAF